MDHENEREQENSIARFFFLPKEKTEAELKHVKQMNKMALYACVAHLPLFMIVAFLCDTGVVSALLWGTFLVIGPLVAYKTLDNPRVLSMIYGFTAMGLGALLVHLGQGPVQIEMHFHFFASLALLTVFGNPLVIWVAAVTVAVHHAVFWYFLPQSVFNYDASFWVVAVHAAFVIVESIAASFIARNFFDNVIGLEKIIRKRTSELNQRNEDMKMILNNTAQGFLTVGSDGYMRYEKSATVLGWFGETPQGEKFWDYMGKTQTEFGGLIQYAFNDLQDDILPLEYGLSQLPKKLVKEGETFHFEYTPIIDANDELSDLLVVVTNVTAEVAKAKAEEQQKEILSVFDVILKDKEGFIEFVEDSEKLIQSITSGSLDKTELARSLHTLKGNSGAFGMMSYFTTCHEIEERILENAGQIGDSDKDLLKSKWTDMKSNMENFLTSSADRIEVDEEELSDVIGLLQKKTPHHEVEGVLKQWRHEPMKKRLLRIAGQAKSIATRLHKGEIAVKISDNRVRLPQDKWSPFWSVIGHVIRNAIDHGLEAEDVRKAKGKPVRGTLELSTDYDDENFVIKIRDDGQGINWDKIKEKAEASGNAVSSREDLKEALFMDGVSTKDHATIYSGRGVGMSAVKTLCDQMGAKIDIESSDQGTEFAFKFPLSEINQWKLSA